MTMTVGILIQIPFFCALFYTVQAYMFHPIEYIDDNHEIVLIFLMASAVLVGFG